MCKIAVMVGLKPAKWKKSWEFAMALTPYLTKKDEDGFGYMAVTKSGNLFGERWLEKKDVYKLRQAVSPFEKKIAEQYLGAFSSEGRYNSFGKITPQNVTAICLHSRMATSDVEMKNTHPFVSGDTALIHNGVVQTDNLKLKTSTCDSEGILNAYVDKKVNEKAKNINKVTKMLDGYYACAVFSKTPAGKMILDVFRDGQANLEAIYVKELEAIVFCTSGTMVLKACEKLGWTAQASFRIQDNVLMRHDAITGKVLEVVRFKTAEEVPSYTSRFSNVLGFPKKSKEPKETAFNDSDDLPSTSTGDVSFDYRDSGGERFGGGYGTLF